MVQRPLRVTFGNLETAETKDAQYNPLEIDDKLEAMYERQGIIGLPHELLQYKGTKNQALTFDLGFDILADGAPVMNDVVGFIDHFLFPPAAAADVGGGSPPRMIFIWPSTYLLVCKLTTRRLQRKRFDLSMANDWLVATLTLEECRVQRLTSEAVRASAGLRGSQ